MISGYFKTTSPQGDGNQCDKKHATAFHADFKTTSPQGDGNTRCPAIGSSCIVSFQNHIPARGRKHWKIQVSADNTRHFKTTSPQGDGNPDHDDRTTVSYHKFQNHIPARGRKLEIILHTAVGLVISKPHPRKGTETTNLSMIGSNVRGRNFKTTSPQGDGNPP